MKKIVRISKIDLPGEKKVGSAIRKIKGIDFMMSNAILEAVGINGNDLLGEIPDAKIEKLKKAINNPAGLDIPKWMLNRRCDVLTGDDLHLTGTEIPLTLREDINRMKDTRSRKGLRHAKGLKVRGQRTKAHPRTGMAVGVITKKKKAKMMKKDGAPAKPAPGAAKKAGPKPAGAKPAAKPAAKKPEGGKA
jgi:small subunit ribosomal protein S13